MRALGIYFTWPMFFVRLVLGVVLMPVMLAAGFLLGTRDYFRYRKYQNWYRPDSYIGHVVDSTKELVKAIGWFVIGGLKVISQD